MADNKLELKIDEADFFVIEENDDFDADALPEEKVKEIDQKNDEFIKSVLTGMCVSHSDPCQCQMMKWQQKQQRRAALMGATPGSVIQVVPDQEDLDAYHYGVVIRAVDGIYKDVTFIVRECKTCHKIDMWGMSSVITQLLAESSTNMITMKKYKEMEESGELQFETIKDDLENGEAPAEESEEGSETGEGCAVEDTAPASEPSDSEGEENSVCDDPLPLPDDAE